MKITDLYLCQDEASEVLCIYKRWPRQHNADRVARATQSGAIYSKIRL